MANMPTEYMLLAKSFAASLSFLDPSLSHLHVNPIDLHNKLVHTLHASTRLVSITICVIFSCQIILQKSANIAFVGPTWIQNE